MKEVEKRKRYLLEKLDSLYEDVFLFERLKNTIEEKEKEIEKIYVELEKIEYGKQIN